MSNLILVLYFLRGFIMKKWYYLVASLIFILSLSCSQKQDKIDSNTIITSIFPIYDFTKQIIKNTGFTAKMILPPAVDAHTYEPKPRDIIAIKNAKLFVYIGKNMEPWAHRLAKTHVSKNKTINILDKLLKSKIIKKQNHHGDHDHKIDPHVWVNPTIAITIIDVLYNNFKKLNSINKPILLKNVVAYKNKLTQLHASLNKRLQSCKFRTVMYAGHFVFNYFTKQYNLQHIVPYKSYSGNAEPTPKLVAAFINKVKKLQVKYIFYGELIKPRIAKLVARETGAKLLLLHGIHNVSKDEFKKNITYISIMKQNRKALRLGLQCK